MGLQTDQCTDVNHPLSAGKSTQVFKQLRLELARSELI